EQVLPIARELHHAGVAVAIRHVKVAIRCERHVGGQVEIAMACAGHPLPAELEDHAPFRVHFQDHVTSDIHCPNVAFRIYPYRVRTAGITGWPGGNYSVGGSIRPRRRGNHSVAPRTHELPAALEFHDRVRSAMEYEDMAARIGRYARYFAKVP